MALSVDTLSTADRDAIRAGLQESFGGPEEEAPEPVEQPEPEPEPEPESDATAEEAEPEQKPASEEPKRAGEKRLLETLREREARLDKFKPIGEDDWSIGVATEFVSWAKSENPTADTLISLLETQLGPGVVQTLESQIIEPRVLEMRDSIRESVEAEILRQYLGTEVPPTKREIERIQAELKSGKYLEEDDEEDQAVLKARKITSAAEEAEKVKEAEKARKEAESKTQAQIEAEQKAQQAQLSFANSVQADAVADLEKLGFEISDSDSPKEQRRKVREARAILEEAWETLQDDPEMAATLATIQANFQNGMFNRNASYAPLLKRKFRDAVLEVHNDNKSRYGGTGTRNTAGRAEPKANGGNMSTGGVFDAKELDKYIATRYGAKS